jgi:hypothetical protein
LGTAVEVQVLRHACVGVPPSPPVAPTTWSTSDPAQPQVSAMASTILMG